MRSPIVLLIDDNPQEAAIPDSVTSIPINPLDETFAEEIEAGVRAADLILLDQNLHREQVLNLSAIDGAGFVGNLRSWARAKEFALPPIAIYTSEEQAFADEIPAVGPAVPIDGNFRGREARLAPALDVEWLVPKDEEGSLSTIASLARDSLALKNLASDNRMNLQEIEDFLALPRGLGWTEIAMSNVAKWRPPISDAGNAPTSSRGATPVLRWLLHQVLPWPGLLLSDLYASWALGLHPDDFVKLVDGNNESEWVKALRATIYSGAGRELAPRRWWAAGIDFVGWQLRERGYSLGNLQAAIDDFAEPGIRCLVGDQTVVLDADLEEVGIVEVSDAIQIRPRGWPEEAVDPWMLREEVANDPIAQTMVDPSELPVTA